ncbi:peptidoglycan DD-metalloendopeptidase family protein [Staphylococcus simiae]|uniref:lysostaphin n=1 Tax=Staphylococcus simiae CCM 7213 = CCUG 51256 TaxID=911238 RepID=G5JH94_9STAP|nr:peptidoglycan DD-metalloendopeptidase family protein [Staphylococcus simiae]EHJ08442.1 hypothetical protein SS7213T_04115 [Staphylococcus simiae CCM 7213 = CCUG 51256]PNZ12546.1 phage tail tape measure protein [Staphylococcus simiae]SNV67418.1 TP901 family phage tail tape measure protein [Staphylococcus simiae]
MAERIKGLQIDLTMNDVGVSKSLAAIKREFRSLNSSLKLSSNNFKYGEKSASSYKERMNDLDKSIKVGTSNLNDLEKQYTQVAQSQGANSAKAVRLQTEYNKQADAINKMKYEYSQLNDYYKMNFSLGGKISNSLSRIGSGLQTAGAKAQSMGQSLTNSITKPALVAGTAMAGITAKLGFDRLVGLDTAKAKLEGLGYSTKEVGSITEQVTRAIKGGMTTMAEGTDVAAGALAAGVKEGKELEHYIKLVGDAAVGANRPVGDMAMIFNRVQGQGKLMTQELNMIEEGMPGFSNAMAKHLGVSYDAFREMVTNGEVSSKEFLTVMDDFAGGMANAYSKSFKGMVQNTKAYIGMIGESLLSGVFEQSKGSLHEFEKMLQSPAAQEWAKETGEKLGNAFNAISNGIKGVINWWNGLGSNTRNVLGNLVKYLGITLITLGPVLTTFGKLASTIGGMFSGISTLISFLIKHNVASKMAAAGQAVWNGVTATAKSIADGYKYAVAALTTSQTLQAVKTKIAAAATVVWTGVTKAASIATRGLGLAIRFMTGPVGLIITAIGLLVAGIIHLWKTNATFRNAVINIWTAIKNAVVSLVKGLANGVINIFNGLKKVISTIFNGIKSVILAIWNGIKTVTGVIVRGYVAYIRLQFTILKKVISVILDVIKVISSKVWNAIKNTAIRLAKGLVTGVRNTFNVLKNAITVTFNGIKNIASKVWNAIKNNVVRIAKGLSNGVRHTFNALKKGITAIFNAIRNTASKIWNSLKNKVVSLATGLWRGVVSRFNSLKKGVSNIFHGIASTSRRIWGGIKKHTVGMATGVWHGVVNAFKKMKNALSPIIDKISGFINKMVNGVKKGLNKLIKGVNWVGDKLGMDKIPEIKLHTGTEHTSKHNIVTNGKVNRDTFATVGDKGRGNGPGGFRHEMIRYPNGKTAITPNRDTTAFLPKGSSVLNGAQTHAILNNSIPRFASGTGWNLLGGGKKPKTHKHKDDLVGDVVSKNGGGAKAIAGKVIDGGKAIVSKTLETAVKGKDWLKDKIGDVMDWMDKPDKLLDKILEGFGVGFDWIKGSLPKDMMTAMFNKLKKATVKLFTSWFDEQGGEGEGGWVDISKGINFPFSPHGRAPGYPFPYPHMGVDLNYVYDKLYSTHSGTATGYTGYNGGFGNHMRIKSGIYEIIYGHMSKLAWTGSKKVHPGSYLGISGNTGMSSGPHLHYEMRKNGTPIDPMPFLRSQTKGKARGKGASYASSIIRKAQNILGGQYKSSYIHNQMMRVAKRESNYDPNAVNDWDINAQRGTPSKGMFQMIEPSFRAYAKKGYGSFTNPLHQAISAMRYIVTKYGWGGFKRAGDYAYATGGLINSSGLYQLAEGGYPEFVIPTDPSRQSDAMKLLAIASRRIEGNKNKRPNQLRTPSISGNTNNDEVLSVMAKQLEATQRQVELLTQLVASTQRIEQQPKGFNEPDISRSQGKRAIMTAYNLGVRH